MSIRTVTSQEADALREDVRASPFGAGSICASKGLKVMPTWRRISVLASGVAGNPSGVSRNLERDRLGLPLLIFAQRRPACRHCLKTIEFGEKVIRFEADLGFYGYTHTGFIHAEECK